ncbi:MAG TPA: type II toxin-antitoxin system RelE/ParE family toxin [Stellaceae bacterium]|nr:type II toxin-antitoxin system RelE/ParE family toxin [Stellaceae bacterium]
MDEPKPLLWRGSSKSNFLTFPRAVQRDMGYALFLAQMGERHSTRAKTLKGFGGGSVVEVVESREGNAYRLVYTVRYSDAIYVLHAFQKKSRKGIATPAAELDLIRRRLRSLAEERSDKGE